MTGLFILLILCAMLLLLIRYSGVLAVEAATGEMELDSISAIERLLPQTQCGKCHYNGCRPYAEAIAGGQADINRCPPGGEGTVRAIADLLGRDPKPLAPDVQQEQPALVALIDEDLCIGCVKCIRACPVDAIMGAPKRMHTVIKKYCTGCELCIAPCPVDCISMVPVRVKTTEWVWSRPDPVHGPRP